MLPQHSEDESSPEPQSRREEDGGGWDKMEEDGGGVINAAISTVKASAIPPCLTSCFRVSQLSDRRSDSLITAIFDSVEQ